MGTTQVWLRAARIYRDSPNTIGHEEVQDKRDALKRIISLVTSQVMLQQSIIDARAQQYYDTSGAQKHLWVRLKEIEDQLRELEELNGEAIKSREYFTHNR